MALGAKLARPDATVVQFVGDGSFYFGIRPRCTGGEAVPAPILTVVFDNSGWGR